MVRIAMRPLEFINLHRHAGYKARDVIRRTPEHTIRQVGDFAMPDHAALEVVSRLRSQVVDGMAPPVFLVGHGLTLRWVSLHVVEPRNCAHGVTKRRMRGDVVDAFAAK